MILVVSTVFGRESDVMIKELTKLHDHVSVAAVWEVVCGVQLVVHLRNGPRVWQPVGNTSSARLLNSILIQTYIYEV